MVDAKQRLDVLVCDRLSISKEQLADIMGVSVHTMKGWNKNMPKPVELALTLLLENYELKRKLEKIHEAHEIIASIKNKS